jgi:hypothetical protein
MKAEHVPEGGFEIYYRKRQHKIMESINPNKVPMYWMNNNNMEIQPTDIVHWWGGQLPPTSNKVVISFYGPYYLDMGVGNYFGVGYGSYITWLDFYNKSVIILIKKMFLEQRHAYGVKSLIDILII